MIVFLTTFLILLCFVVVLLIMIQRTSGGMGSALGGGTADQVLGAGSAAQLTKMTVWCILGFFVLSFSLYAFYQYEARSSDQLQRLGTDTPVLQPNPILPVASDGLIAVPSSGSIEVPVPLPVEKAPVVSDPVSETNSTK